MTPIDHSTDEIMVALGEAENDLANVTKRFWTASIFYLDSADKATDEPAFTTGECDRSFGRAATEAVTLHFTVLASPEDDGEEASAGDQPKIRSVLALPLFDPEVFDPDPINRPVLGAIVFGSDMTDKAILDSVEILLIAEKHAELLSAQDIKHKLIS
jgi:hypothetical protein